MKTNRTLFLSLTTLMAVAMFILAGCGGAANRKANEEAADTLKKELTLTPEAQNLLYQLPTPFEVTSLLQEAQAGYIFDITNPIGNVGKYMTEKTKAINLGVYSADLAYAATYHHIDNTNQLMGCTGKLADELGIAGVYHPDLVEKVKAFSNNKDSLVAMVSNIFISTNDFLSKNNRNQVAVYIGAGAFTEGLYLASSLNVVAKDNTKIAAILFAQADTYNKLMTLLKLYETDETMKPVYDEMLKLAPVFTSYAPPAGTSLDAQKAGEVMDIIEGVRNGFVN